MSSTNFQIGFSDNMKNSSKVLKPPGGGSTDLFGATIGDTPSTPRAVKNYMKSTIFAAPEPVNKHGDVRRPQADSHNRLFGEPDQACTPAKNRLRSNIPIGGDESDASSKQSNGTNQKAVNGGSVVDGNNGVNKGANPMNGDKFAAREINTQIPSLNGNNDSHVINKNRIPPGGFSSGLW
jgi:hypothetical protein